MFELVFLSGARAGAIVPVSGVMGAGRHPECDIEVPDLNVSRNHARFEFDGTRLNVVDNGSSNGTYVNEVRITEQPVQHGDIVRMGETRIRVQRRLPSEDSSSEYSRSSMFGFNESSSADLSQSMSMSVYQTPSSGSVDTMDVTQRLNVIMWVADALATITRIDDLLGQVLDTLFEVFPQAERGFLILGDSWENLVPRAMRNKTGHTTERMEVSSSLCREALRRKEVMTWNEGARTDFDQGMSLVSLNIRSAMVVPMMVREEVLGLLVIDTSDRRRSFTSSDMELAGAVCRQVAIALKNAMLVEQVERETKTRQNLVRFLPRPVVDQALDGHLELALGGSACQGTIFFADVIGFTRMVEAMNPEDVISMMNIFFDRMVPCIEQEGGAIDKFMGDCIMAFWGVPFPTQDASLHAVAAGLTMHNALYGLNGERRAADLPAMGLGVGLQSGRVVAGNIGSDDRAEYTVLGDVVNTAMRIQSQACAGQVLVGAEAWQEISAQAYGVCMPAVQVKNRREAVQAYCVRAVQVAGGELLLHIPVVIGGEPALLIRRLADGQFVVLHHPDVPLVDTAVTTDLVELESLDCGSITAADTLPRQRVDGTMRRSQITLSDQSLGDLLGSEPLACSYPWERMRRGVDDSGDDAQAD